MARRFPGVVPEAELGFRFGVPLDMDGDGQADVAAGARFERHGGAPDVGTVYVWSGRTAALMRTWEGAAEPSLFGHWVLPISDLDRDRLADVLIAAPVAPVDGVIRGVVTARSPRSGAEIWRRNGAPHGHFGWDLALAGDHDGDGHDDVFVGEPAPAGGRVHLLSGTDGRVLRTYAPRATTSAFGWVVARLDDVDGDGLPDLAVGAQPKHGPDDPPGGDAYVFSSARGEELLHWRGKDPDAGFAELVASVGDMDGDGRGDVAVSSPATRDRSNTRPGVVEVYSSKTGAEVRRWSGTQKAELYGRMVVTAGDLDDDGTDDVAIGAPWWRCTAGERCGRIELRSGKSGAVLNEIAGTAPDAWFGWHIRRAPDPDRRGRPALLIASLRAAVEGQPGVGMLETWVLVARKAPAAPTVAPSGAAPAGATSGTP